MGVWASMSLVAPIPGAGKSRAGRAAAAGRAPADGVAGEVAAAGDAGAGDRLRDSDGAAVGVVGAAAGDIGFDGAAGVRMDAAGSDVAGSDVSARAARPAWAAGLTRRLRYVMSVRMLDLFSAIA
ncbi:hypothetical protein QFZ79_001754 [Arthrobacter sp. V4I6]|uniref:hypothetical protein n=1 Tax=unclassified Arthrobacter TaxID=235627 RepID=UPI00278998DE|nr:MULTISPECIES: hypothetical protein [unclassified Arthrobacter]MDQ0819461.1 hypothetical protein [Arthrobacter sp. V1I7]MDQ0853643.1 hypothetical protein [Arthrobacter sp. V4I6]